MLSALLAAGKSRLLEDIECLAQRDTPTGRQIFVNNRIPDEDQRFSAEHKLVAQLSQKHELCNRPDRRGIHRSACGQ